VPRYQQIISALTWMSHAQNLRRVAAEHTIDLYLRPPVTRFRLMDFHLMERIVRDANRCRPPPPALFLSMAARSPASDAPCVLAFLSSQASLNMLFRDGALMKR